MWPNHSKECCMTSKTLTELLAHNAEVYSDTLFVRFLKRGEAVANCTYGQLWERASQWAALLKEQDILPGDAVALALPNRDEFVYAYFGTLLARGVPAPLAPFRRLKPNDHYLATVAQRLQFISAKVLVVPEEQADIISLPPLSSLEHLIVLTRHNVQSTSGLILPQNSADDIGLFQFTSGTSGNAKVVQLTHTALLAQMRNISHSLAVDHHQDSGLSWLPLFHDMGMIGYLLTPMYHAINTTLLQTEDFMMRPSLWVKGLSDFRITITAGPPSAYAQCARHLKDSEIEQYDLSHLRAAVVGAEVISRESLQQFATRLQPAGFRATSFVPAYGLAENGVAVTMTPLHHGPEFDLIDLEIMQTQGIAHPVQQSNGHTSNGSTRVVASAGIPIPQTEIAIVNSTGERLGERQVGEILVHSPSLMLGYYHQPEISQQ